MVFVFLWKIQIWIILSLCGEERAYLRAQKQLEIENDRIYEPLAAVAKSDDFSKIKLLFANECPRGVQKCSAVGCKVKQMEFQGRSGVIDLLQSPESYSPEAYKTGPAVWSDIDDIVKNHQLLKKIVSGLRFSINTHIAAFYRPDGQGGFTSNPWLFKRKMYTTEYEQNFLFLYQFLRRALVMLAAKEGVLAGVAEIGAIIRQEVGESVETSAEVEAEAVEAVGRMISALGCLNCQKCMLWGTIQLRSLKAAIKAINGMDVTRLDAVCLVNGFRRVSVSLREGRKLKEASLVSIELVYVYGQQICAVLILLGVGLILVLKSRWLKILMLRNKLIKDCL